MIHGRVLPAVLAAACAVFSLASCTSSNDWGGYHTPFVHDAKGFVPTEVPKDFSIIVYETHNTFNARQTVQQVITAADGISRNTYTTYRDYNNSVADTFTRETALTQPQLQAMWNDVAKNNLMSGSTLWINGAATADVYKKNVYRVEVIADGRKRTYEETNGFPGAVRPLMLLVTAVRLPISQDPGTPVVTAEPSSGQ